VTERESLYVEGLPAEVPSEHVLGFLLARCGETVVDLGCGYGAYASRISASGRRVVGVELDPDAVDRARAEGVDAHIGDVTALPFEDGSYDTAVLVDVLEHIPEPVRVVREALRVARRNVLVTVPNVGEYDRLARYGVTYWHLVTSDHVNFFNGSDLRAVASDAGGVADVDVAEPLEACALVRERGGWWYALAALARLRLLRPVAYNRLYAEIRHVPAG
jgi:SAM-dependent methyltransferase